MLALFFVPADIDLLTQNKRRNTSMFVDLNCSYFYRATLY